MGDICLACLQGNNPPPGSDSAKAERRTIAVVLTVECYGIDRMKKSIEECPIHGDVLRKHFRIFTDAKKRHEE